MLDPNAEYYRVVPPDRNITDPTELPFHTFIPRDIDRNQLSIYDSHLISPRECLDLYNRRPDRPQARAVAVITTAEIQSQGLTPEPHPTNYHHAHCIIDFNVLDSKSQQIASTLLKETAQERGVILDP